MRSTRDGKGEAATCVCYRAVNKAEGLDLEEQRERRYTVRVPISLARMAFGN